MERIFVKPCEGKRVRDLDGTLIPNEGKEVLKTTYINRQIKAGDLETAMAVPKKK